jgi:hypothetical protein
MKKKPPLSETQFDQLMPDALNPHGIDDDNETDWPAWALGSGVASVIALILLFLDMHFADQIFKGRSFELAQNVSYCLIAAVLGFGLYCVYACIRARAQITHAAKKHSPRKPKR